MVMLEAMAAGIPVIASDFEMWRDEFGPLGCILFVDPKDPAQIAKAIDDLLSDPKEAKRMGELGQKAVREQFTWESQAEKLLQLFREIEVEIGKSPRITELSSAESESMVDDAKLR